MKTPRVAFIGGGNMASSLIGGLITDGYSPDTIWVADPISEQRSRLQSQFKVHTHADNHAVIESAAVLVLAVKPQLLREVVEPLANAVQHHKPLVISVAAGVREPDLRRWLGDQVAIVRSMPNTPALVKSGATALYANVHVSDQQQQLAESILRAVGLTIWVNDENLLDSVTALSGSGPAYFFLVMEALEKGGIKLGLSEKQARLLTLETAFGAAKMALESPQSPASLRNRVTSPGGTTERAIEVLQEGQLETLFVNALEAARQRARELGDLLGGQP